MAAPARLAPILQGLFETPADGRAKLWALWRCLQLRAERPRLFRDGSYAGLALAGARAAHGVAFVRQYEGDACLVIAGRMFTGLAPIGNLPMGSAVWQDTAVDVTAVEGGATWENRLTGRTVQVQGGRLALAEALADFPAAILVRCDGATGTDPH